uniref:Secreted peptide n=1 Tax=Anopheles braziliensis TaxID=58242 RepID=A0A2M3ZLF3_9DIPT
MSVSIRTAVWALMCVQPTMFAPLSGLSSRACLRSPMMPGISCSAISISCRPNECCLMLRTQKSAKPLEFCCVLSRGDRSSSSELLSVYELMLILLPHSMDCY